MADVIVIGAGPAGLMAAAAAAENGRRAAVYDTNALPPRKLLITGKGRCNLTNDCGPDELIASVPRNGRFLYSAFSAFSPRDLMAFFESCGVPLKVERGNRVFPVSDKAADVAAALAAHAKSRGAQIRQGRVKALLCEDGRVFGVRLADGRAVLADAVVVATGGLSYPKTGSTGDGYRFARQAGHTVVPMSPSLVPLESDDGFCAQMAGLSLRNIAVAVFDRRRDKIIYRDFGELLFAHFGLTGPVILSASAHMDGMEPGRYTVFIDLKPALTPEQLDARLLRDFEKYQNRDFANSLGDLLPRLMIPIVRRLSGVDSQMKTHQLTREMRQSLAGLLKRFPVSVAGFRPIEEAVVTRGGVSTKEIDPKTMRSKLACGLSFAGEVIDVDAYTGGFNLQIAFSTGYLAGKSI